MGGIAEPSTVREVDARPGREINWTLPKGISGPGTFELPVSHSMLRTIVSSVHSNGEDG